MWYFYIPAVPLLHSGVVVFFSIYFRVCTLSLGQCPGAVCALPASPTTFAFVVGLQMRFMVEQLLHAATPPPRGVQQPCLCKLSCCLFFFIYLQKHVWVCFCVHLAGSSCLHIIGSVYKNVPEHTAVETASLNPTTLPALAAQATINYTNRLPPG